MVCLTSCVFRSIRFSGFARPHFGVRREGELYTQAQGEGKGGRGAPRDAHKSGDNGSLGAFPPCEADQPAARMGPSAPRDRPQGRAAPALTSELQVPPRLLANRDPAP